MKNRNTIYFLSLLVLITSISCSKGASVEATTAVREKQNEQKDLAANTIEEPSDLDRPVKDLVALTCEHKIKTFACDECRYEVGFVRAPADLMKDGLVTTVKAQRQNISVPIMLTGEIQFDARRIIHVNSQVTGIVKKVYVTLGDSVKKGQPLFEIESVTIGEFQTAYLEAQGLLKLARRNYERVTALRTENIASGKEFLLAKQEFEAAEIRANGELGKLTRLGSDPEELRELTSGNCRGHLVLRAPVAGTILDMHAVLGEVAKTEESMITVGDNTTVWVWADLYERDIAVVKHGQAARKLTAAISVKSYPGEEFSGIVDLVSPAMDESSRTVKVRIDVKNTDGRLLVGMFATVKLFLTGTEETLAVPMDSVLEDEGRSFVFVHHHDDYYVRRPVVVGRTWAGLVEIKQGINLGQTVVAGGAFLMKSDVLRSKMGAGCAD